MKKQEILKGLKGHGAYDFICNNYYKMDLSTLKDIAKETIYLLNEEQQNEFLKNLKECWSWGIEDEE